MRRWGRGWYVSLFFPFTLRRGALAILGCLFLMVMLELITLFLNSFIERNIRSSRLRIVWRRMDWWLGGWRGSCEGLWMGSGRSIAGYRVDWVEGLQGLHVDRLGTHRKSL